MPQTCRVCLKTNPEPAAYCYYDGTPLQSADAKGPLHMGTMPFPRPFFFSDGRPRANFNELVHACHEHWTEGQTLLADGILASFFGAMGRADLAMAAQQAARQPDRDRGLSELLQQLPADVDFLRPAQVAVEAKEMNLGPLTPGTDHTFDLVIVNRGLLVLHGLVWTECSWLTFGTQVGACEKLFQTRDFFTVSVRVPGSQVRAGRLPLKGEIVIESNGGDLVVPVRAQVPIRPFPKGVHGKDVLAGVTTPKELAFRAKNNLKEAAVIFQRGAVKDWYASNGWDYPIHGCEGLGNGAVQQFFEALGLTKPPRLEIQPKFLVYQGHAGQRITKYITVSTDESRPVYAEASCNQDWVKFGPTKYLGDEVKIPIEVEMPPLPGETVQVQAAIRGNGKQEFSIPINVTILSGPPNSPPGGGRMWALASWGLLVIAAGLLLTLVAFVVPTIFFPGSQTPAGAPPGMATKPTGFDSPRAAFQGLSDACAKGQWDKASNCLTVPAKNALAGVFVLAAKVQKPAGEADAFQQAFATHAEAVLARNKVDVGRVLQRLEVNQGNDAVVRRILSDVAGPAQNNKRYLPDMLRAASTSLDMTDTLLGKDAQLNDLKETLNQATAHVVCGDRRQQLAFHKSANGWLVALSEPMYRNLLEHCVRTAKDNQIAPLTLTDGTAYVKGHVNLADAKDLNHKLPCKIFRVHLTKDTIYDFHLESLDFEPKLRIEDASGKPPTTEPPDTDEHSAEMRLQVPNTGEYRVIASLPVRWTGRFALEVTSRRIEKPAAWVDAIFGDWSMVRQKDDSLLLVDQKARRVLKLPKTPGTGLSFCDDIGRTYRLDETGRQTALKWKIDADLFKRPPGDNSLTPGRVYQFGDWRIRATPSRVVIQPADAKVTERLLINRTPGEFTYQKRLYKIPETLPEPAPYILSTFPGSFPKRKTSGIKFDNLKPYYPWDVVRQAPCRIYKIRLVQGKQYYIRLASSNFNAYLRLEDDAGQPLDQNDNEDGINAGIHHYALRTGDYRIIATASRDGSGPYSLSVREEDLPRISIGNSGKSEFFQNGVKIGLWSLWTGPFRKPVKSYMFLLHERTGQAMYLPFDSKGWFNYRDAKGTWHSVHRSTMTARRSADKERYYTGVKSKLPPNKFAAVGTFPAGNWIVQIRFDHLKFTCTKSKDYLVIRPFSEAFSVNGKTHAGPAVQRKEDDVPDNPSFFPQEPDHVQTRYVPDL